MIHSWILGMVLSFLGMAVWAVDVPPTSTFTPAPRLIMGDQHLRDIKAALVTTPDTLRSELTTYLYSLANYSTQVDILTYDQITTDFESDFPGPRTPDHFGDLTIRTARRVQGLILTWAMASRIAEVVDRDMIASEKWGRLAIRQMATVAHEDFHWDRARAEGLNGTFLSVAEMSLGVAIGFDWLASHPSWWIIDGINTRPAVAKALYDKALFLGRDAYGAIPSSYTTSWVKGAYNWTQVCNAGLLAAALALAGEHNAVGVTSAVLEDDIALTIRGACASLNRAQSMYRPAGVYSEGVGYWGYGTIYQVLAISMLERALAGNPEFIDAHVKPLWDNPGFQGTGLFRMSIVGPTGIPFTYSDTGVTANAYTQRDNPGVALSWIGKKQENVDILAYNRQALKNRFPRPLPQPTESFQISPSVIGDGYFFNYLAFPLHYLWLPSADASRSPPSTATTHQDYLFRGNPLGNRGSNTVELAVFRNSPTNIDDWWVAVKAGASGIGHSHHDLGSFVLEHQGVRWAADLGADTDGEVVDGVNLYADDDQGGKRWDYLLCGTHGHNVLTPGGMQQHIVSLAPITSFSSTSSHGAAVVDLTGVYPGMATRIARGIELVDHRQQVVIQDDFAGLRAGVPLLWRMMTRASITSVSGNPRSIILTQTPPDGRLRTLYMDVLSPTNATITVEAVNSLPQRLRTFDGYSRITVTVPPKTSIGNAQVVVRFRSTTSPNSLGSLPRNPAWTWTPASGTPLQLPTITARTSIPVVPGRGFSTTLTGTGAPWTGGWSASSLPAWLRLDATTGVLSGMVPGTFSGALRFDVTVTNAGGSAQTSFTLASAAEKLPVIPTQTFTGTLGTNGSWQVFPSQADRPSSIRYQGLPKGLRGNDFFKVSGTPTEAGNYRVQIEAQNAFGSYGGTIVMRINPVGSAALPVLAATPDPLNLP
jgi:hypothetical protein